MKAATVRERLIHPLDVSELHTLEIGLQLLVECCQDEKCSPLALQGCDIDEVLAVALRMLERLGIGGGS